MTKKSIDKKLELQLRGLKAIFEKRKADLRNIYNAILSLGEFFRPVTGYNTGLKLFYDKDGGRIELTNNGLVMIKELKDRNNNAVAKSLLKLGKGFAEKFGDGSKRLIILIADLMEVALELMGEGFHPNLIIKSLNKLGLFIESLLKSLLFSIETDKGTSLVKDDRGRPNIDINGAFMGANKNEKIGLIFEAMRSLLVVLLENREGKEKNVATVANLEYERKLLLSTLISQYDSEAAHFLADQTLKLYQNIKNNQSSIKFKGLNDHQRSAFALNILGNFDPDDYFKFILIPGHSISEIDLLNGIVLDKEEKFVENFPEKGLRPAKILISGEKLYFEDFKESDRPEIEFNFEDNKGQKNKGTTRNLGLLKVGGMGDTYNLAYQSKAERIIKTLKELGVNLLITEKGIDKNLEARLINEGIYYLRRIKLKQLKQLSRYLG
ncbi:MAG: TCP-1/cpn60 chaperonin family protein, partial [Promethearchaeota archaeon]